MIAALLGGAVVIDYGVKSFKTATASAGGSNASGGSTTPTFSTHGGKTIIGDVTDAELIAIGALHGWSGQQLSDWASLIKSESNGTITDTNPSSGAYGIAQGITGPGWYAAHGGSPDTVTGQLTAMANYIAQRYGNPSAAWSFHRANNWY